MVTSPIRTAPFRVETLGRLWQRAWFDAVALGGPLRFADWLDQLPGDLDSTSHESWRLDLRVAREVARHGAGAVVVEPEPGRGCLSREAVLVVETALADLKTHDAPIGESVELLAAAVEELAQAERWPVPLGMRGRLEALAGQLADALAATGAQIRDVDRLLGVPPEDSGQVSAGVVDLDLAVAACLAVPRGVLAGSSSGPARAHAGTPELDRSPVSTRELVRRLVRGRRVR